MPLLLPCTARAQARLTGTDVTGRVIDATGAVLTEATVTVINEETGVTPVVRTNGRGQFQAPRCPPAGIRSPSSNPASVVRNQDPERGPLVRRAFEDLATGRYTKQEVIARATEAGLRGRKRPRLSPQSCRRAA